MSRTIGHGTGGTHTNTQSKEWWTRRPFSCVVADGSTATHLYKRWTHKIERARAKRAARKEALDGDAE